MSNIRSQTTLLRIRSLQGKISARYYSSAGVHKDGAAVETSQSEIEDNDPMKRDLEFKNKEIIDLKVRPMLRKSQCYMLLQTHTFDL